MLEVLYENPDVTPADGIGLPPNIRSRHGGDFALLRSTSLFSNFVITIDGIVELGDPTVSSGSAISARNDDDRFVMGLLRAFAEFILVGAGTFNSEPLHAWTAQSIFPALANDFAQLRRELGLPATPALLVATRSGNINRNHAAFDAQQVELIPDVTALPSGLVLTEGGPRLMGSLGGRVDEVFMTHSPALAGRAGPGRLGMMEGVEFPPTELLRHRLLSVRRADSFLFTRHQRVAVPAGS